MNLEDYKQKIELYRKFADTVCDILHIAINSTKLNKVHYISCRPKDLKSLKNKIQKDKYQEKNKDKIEDFITDLAGCRIVFYHDSDINRFRNSGIIEANFEIDPKRSLEYLPERGKRTAEDYYKGIHYIVKLKENRTNLPEYSKFKDLFCEIQLHSALNNVFSQVSHDITYKPNISDKIGQERMNSINGMLCDIADKYLIPAQLEFEKVKINYQRLLDGKELVDSQKIEAARKGEITDNNDLYAFLQSYKSVMRDYNNLDELIEEAFEICKTSLEVARNNKSQIITTNWGDIKGKEYSEIAEICLEILDLFRYRIKTEKMVPLLLSYSLSNNKIIRDKVKKNLENISKYKIRLLEKVGLGFHMLLVEEINKLDVNGKTQYSSAISIICRNLLSCEKSDESSSYESFTWQRGSIVASDGFRKIRSDALKILQETYEIIKESSLNDKFEKCLELLEAMNHACWQNSQSEKNDKNFYDLFNLVLENSKEVVRFYTSKISDRDYKLIQAMEHSVARLHYRSSEINSENTPSQDVIKTSDELKILIEKFRDTAWQDEEYVIYRDLTSGYYDFRSINKSYWGEVSNDEQKVVEQYAEKVNEQNVDKWLKRLLGIIRSEGGDKLFPVQIFLINLARKRSELALNILKNNSKEIDDLNIEGTNSIVVLSLLLGLLDEKRSDVEDLIADYLSKGIYLRESILSLSGSKNNINFALLEKLLNKANQDIASKKENSDVLVSFIQIINNNRFPENDKEAKAFVLKVIKDLIRNNNNEWIKHTYPNSFVGEVIEGLDNLEDVKIILDSMVYLDRIYYSDEEVLARLVKKYPDAVIDFFDKRLSKEGSRDMARYDAIPYEFYNKTLKQELSKFVGKLLETAKNSFDKDKTLFVFKWGKLLQIIFDDFPQNFVDELANIAGSKDENDIEFVLKILIGVTTLEDCKSIEKLKAVCKAVIKNPIYQEDKFYLELSIALTSTGVVTGKYGFAEASERRVAEMKDWENDSNDKVKGFYKKFSESELETARRERIRVDEQEELRKYEFENS